MKRAELTADNVLNRSRMRIFAEILEVHRKPAAKPRAICEASISNPDFQILVNQLLRSKLLEFNDHVTKFATTEKGLEFIKKFNALQELLKS